MESAQMTDETLMIDVMESRARRREDRRDFFRQMGGKALMSGAAAVAATTQAVAQTVSPADQQDRDVLNFALNLEYLEAQFYSFASYGRSLDNNLLTGTTGTQGPVTGGREVQFQSTLVRQYAREIANDEIAHVRFLRTALGSAAVASPAIDVGAQATGAFSAAARAAGLVGPGEAFDPYSSDLNFLLGAFIFEDVGVTAYKGAAALIANKDFLEAAAGILAVEAYHAGLIRTVLYSMGVAPPMASRAAADAISDARDRLDGTGTGNDVDQGISQGSSPFPPAAAPAGSTLPAGSVASNIVPVDANGLAFSRTAAQVLNIVYLDRTATARGGFFPNGVNGNIRTSAMN